MSCILLDILKNVISYITLSFCCLINFCHSPLISENFFQIFIMESLKLFNFSPFGFFKKLLFETITCVFMSEYEIHFLKPGC